MPAPAGHAPLQAPRSTARRRRAAQPPKPGPSRHGAWRPAPVWGRERRREVPAWHAGHPAGAGSPASHGSRRGALDLWRLLRAQPRCCCADSPSPPPGFAPRAAAYAATSPASPLLPPASDSGSAAVSSSEPRRPPLRPKLPDSGRRGQAESEAAVRVGRLRPPRSVGRARTAVACSWGTPSVRFRRRCAGVPAQGPDRDRRRRDQHRDPLSTR